MVQTVVSFLSLVIPLWNDLPLSSHEKKIQLKRPSSP